jgi:hypothetical protein
MKQTLRSLLIVATLTLAAAPAFTQGPTGGDPPPVVTGSQSGNSTTSGSSGSSTTTSSSNHSRVKHPATTVTVITILLGFLGL